MRPEENEHYYDEVYKKYEHYSLNVSGYDCRYNWLYNNVKKKLTKEERIFEIGCGTGHLAEILLKEKYNYVFGMDFSEVAVEMSRIRCNKNLFFCADIYSFPLTSVNKFKEFEYDTIISLEVIEHLEKDLEVIKRIPEGKRVIFSIPSYDCQGHVRFYPDEKDVLERFEKLFTSFKIETIGKIYIIDTIK